LGAAAFLAAGLAAVALVTRPDLVLDRAAAAAAGFSAVSLVYIS